MKKRVILIVLALLLRFAVPYEAQLKWASDFAQQAREELYAYSIYWDTVDGAPAHDFFMGVSETEPTYELLGDGVSELESLETDGLYLFMFLVACGSTNS